MKSFLLKDNEKKYSSIWTFKTYILYAFFVIYFLAQSELTLFCFTNFFLCLFFDYVQNGTTCSIKPQQITYVVPGVENFDYTQIPDFLQRADDNLVSCVL